MAKKVRKPRSASPRTYGQSGPQPAQSVPPAAAAPEARPVYKPSVAAAQAVPRPAKVVDLRAEYPFVGRDLRRLGITAAAMFAVLIVLNLLSNLIR